MFAKVFTVLVIALFAQGTLAATCSRSYTIKEGDVCDSISAANSVSTFQLAALNPDINQGCTNLVPGNTLCLGSEGEDCSTTYTVVAGDICDDIASAHGVNSTILFMNNPQIDSNCGNIYIGEILCVSQSVQVPASPAVPVTNPPSATLASTPETTTAVNTTPVTTIAVNTTPVPDATPTPPPAVTGTPSSGSSSPSSSSGSSSGSSGAPSSGSTDESGGGDDGSDDGDDDDLPFCDEM